MSEKKNDAHTMVVMSGGLDSTICLYWAIENLGKENVHGITFDYGQRHDAELISAIRISKLADIHERHHLVKIPSTLLRTASPLMNKNKILNQFDSIEEINLKESTGQVEDTFVPLRNALFGVIAANHAYAEGCSSIVMGVSQEDAANYPDCKESFIYDLRGMIKEALGIIGTAKNSFEIYTPLINSHKSQSIYRCLAYEGCWYALAHSHTSYAGDFPPLDRNHATVTREAAFEKLGLPDPLILRAFKVGKMSLPETPAYEEYKKNFGRIPDDYGESKYKRQFK